MNFDKEEAQLLFTVDKFFGTTNGVPYKEITKVEISEDGSETRRTIRSPDENLPNVMYELQRLELALCGGTITSIFTNTTVNDLDFYMINPQKRKEVEAFFEKYFIKEYSSINAITYVRKSPKSNKKWRIQLIIKFTGNPYDIFEWFDFTITHGAYRFDVKQFEFGDRFFQDVSKRRLVYSGNSQYPICAMYRTKKYVSRGYDLPGATIMHIALCIIQLKIESYADLKAQLMGIDTMYLQKLLEAKDPNAPVNYGEFVHEAFQVIDHIGSTLAELEDEDD
ncbi:hypothetical protein [Flavobacterium sp.]|jgi:hypothetical protein|uniref:hypothetical protein n=1 Tax=Flavobacterium sp. TaxID=239 RepID=UPI0037BEFAED